MEYCITYDVKSAVGSMDVLPLSPIGSEMSSLPECATSIYVYFDPSYTQQFALCNIQVLMEVSSIRTTHKTWCTHNLCDFDKSVRILTNLASDILLANYSQIFVMISSDFLVECKPLYRVKDHKDADSNTAVAIMIYFLLQH